MIIPVWQPFASSTHQLAAQVGSFLGEKATHTGTLDPMAEGVVVVLSGDDRHLKGTLPWLKTYEFSLLWGMTTDSLDQMGLITGLSDNSVKPSEELLTAALAHFGPGYLQTQPTFSARRIDGESSHYWAQQHLELPPHSREVDIIELEITGSSSLTNDKLLAEHQTHLSLVKGEFRQADISHNWYEKLSKNHSQTLWHLTHCRVTTSPGCYIRQLVQDIAQHCGLLATTWRICRTQNGPFSYQNSYQMSDFPVL